MSQTYERFSQLGQEPTANQNTENHTAAEQLAALVDRLHQVNSAERSRLYQEIIHFCAQHIEDLAEFLKVLRQKEQLGSVFAKKVLDKLITSDRIVQVIQEHKLVPSKALFITLANLAAENKGVNQLLEKLFQLTSKFSSQMDESDTSQKLMVADYAQQFGLNLIDAIFDSRENQRLFNVLMNFWHAEAEREDHACNLYIFLTGQAQLLSDEEDKEICDAIVEVLTLVEAAQLRFSQDHLRNRLQKFMPDVVRLFGKRMQKSRFTLFWKQHVELMKEFLDDGNQSFFSVLVPRSQHNVVNIANYLFIYRQHLSLQEDQNVRTFHLELPDEAQVFAMGKKASMSEAELGRRVRQLILDYYHQQSSEARYESSEVFVEVVIRCIAPEMDEEALKNKIETTRQAAAGGMSTISERGDSITLRVDESEGDAYLRSLGIQSLTFSQTPTGIHCVVHWFNTELRVSIDSFYHLEGLDNLDNVLRLWFEYVLLQYIAGIKQNLGETDLNIAPLNGEGEGKLFKGRRPHLKVLPYGQQTRRVDLSNPYLSDPEETRFVLTHFGVSLFTLNMLFSSIQDDITYLRPENFQILLDGFEEQLPQSMKMRTNAETVRSIMIEAVRRTSHRQRKVQYRTQQRGSMQISEPQASTALSSATERFGITLVHEAKPKIEGIEVPPMHFWLPDVSDAILQLSEPGDLS